MARLVYAFAVSAAVWGPAASAFAAEPRAAVEGALPAELQTEIVRAIGDTDRPIQNRFEARRRAQEAAQNAITVLRSEGYYAYQIDSDIADGDAPRPVVKIDPGPRFLLADPRLDWIGAPPDPATAAAAVGALGLKPGEAGRAAEVVSAEGRAVAAVQKRGYADVKTAPREVVVDHADHTVRPTYRIEAGKLVRLDGILLETAGRTRKEWLLALSPWKSGETYDPEDVAELERRVLDAGIYESVTVALAAPEDVTPEGLRPILVSLVERKPRRLEVGASYSTSEGAGLDVRWTRFNRLGRADTTTLIARASELDSRLEADLSLPHWRKPNQTLEGKAAVYRTQTPAYDQQGVMATADVTRRFGPRATFGLSGTYVTYGVSLDFSRTSEVRIGSLTPLGRDVVTVGTLLDLALDRSDDPLNPRHGWRISGRAEPTLLSGSGVVPYLKVQSQATAYLPLGKDARTVIAARVHVGSLLNGALDDIPAPQRFYAGGGGSVRGFGYQEVGPRLANNTPQGGLSLLEGSLEVRHDLTPKWGLVGFVDAGTIDDAATPGLADLAIGAGFGVRYNLGFGPIRVDVATPVTMRHGAAPFQIYVSIGQAF